MKRQKAVPGKLRYDWHESGMVPDPTGSYIYHTDHAASIAELAAEVARLRLQNAIERGRDGAGA